MQSFKISALGNLNRLISLASSCASRSVQSLNITLPPTSSIGDVLQLCQSCHRSTKTPNFPQLFMYVFIYTCVIVSSFSTLGIIKPDLFGIYLLIQHHFLFQRMKVYLR
ncbi:hypothetical protein CHARACLAT_014541 [Characodon lateralis]|uniref:Uncharacterized protein n=1 Tax=Characodon lateralis TaxID=208331 RepID=A0ABU7F5A0_9TELE|nr:hypothetical protein [Characodon lateralis]